MVKLFTVHNFPRYIGHLETRKNLPSLYGRVSLTIMLQFWTAKSNYFRDYDTSSIVLKWKVFM